MHYRKDGRAKNWKGQNNMLNNILTRVNDFMYTYPLLILLVGAGVYFTVRTRFVQGRLLGEAFACCLKKRR